jgi:hypothetical protein
MGRIAAQKDILNAGHLNQRYICIRKWAFKLDCKSMEESESVAKYEFADSRVNASFGKILSMRDGCIYWCPTHMPA